jgi:long-subunit fatty acid transport protein
MFQGQNLMQNMGMNNNPNNKSQNNFLNYKIVKCKNWEKDHTCKYGAHCTFAHGDADLRNKADNLYQMNNSLNMMVPMAVPPGMDMNQMQQIMLSNQLMMSMNPQFQSQTQNGNQGNKEMKGDK